MSITIVAAHCYSTDLKMSPNLITRNRHLSKYFYKIPVNYTYCDFTYCLTTVLLGKYHHKYRLHEFRKFLWVTILFLWVTKFAYRKGLGTCDAHLCLPHTLKSTLESGQEATIVQLDFTSAFDRVNHQGLLYEVCSVGNGGYVLSILTLFLSNLSHYVMLNGCRINWLTLCHECSRVAFFYRYCSSRSLWRFFHPGK